MKIFNVLRNAKRSAKFSFDWWAYIDWCQNHETHYIYINNNNILTASPSS